MRKSCQDAKAEDMLDDCPGAQLRLFARPFSKIRITFKVNYEEFAN
jgi:hypothetical protein